MKSWRCVTGLAGAAMMLMAPQGALAGPGIELAQTLTAPGEPLDKRETPEGSPAAGGVLPEDGVTAGEAAGKALTVDDMLAQLGAANITYSVPESDIRDWLANADYTPYPAVATGLIKLLGGKRLQKALDLDVIVYDYESTAGVQSPRKVEEVGQDVLTAAVLKGYNARHGASARNLSDITE